MQYGGLILMIYLAIDIHESMALLQSKTGLMASISTVLFLLTVPVLKTVIFATVDCVINSFCLLFCFHHWDKYYICICKGFIYLVEALCFKKSKMEEITLNLGVTSSQAKLDRLET
eukprot:144484_1